MLSMFRNPSHQYPNQSVTNALTLKLRKAAATGNLFAETQVLAETQAAMVIAETKNSTWHYDEISKYQRFHSSDSWWEILWSGTFS